MIEANRLNRSKSLSLSLPLSFSRCTLQYFTLYRLVEANDEIDFHLQRRNGRFPFVNETQAKRSEEFTRETPITDYLLLI